MESLKYTVIKSKAQYKEYCKALEELIDSDAKSKATGDEIDLLTLLIEKWDDEADLETNCRHLQSISVSNSGVPDPPVIHSR
jgi:hypothetical protein